MTKQNILCSFVWPWPVASDIVFVPRRYPCPFLPLTVCQLANTHTVQFCKPLYLHLAAYMQTAYPYTPNKLDKILFKFFPKLALKI